MNVRCAISVGNRRVKVMHVEEGLPYENLIEVLQRGMNVKVSVFSKDVMGALYEHPVHADIVCPAHLKLFLLEQQQLFQAVKPWATFPDASQVLKEHLRQQIEDRLEYEIRRDEYALREANRLGISDVSGMLKYIEARIGSLDRYNGETIVKLFRNLLLVDRIERRNPHLHMMEFIQSSKHIAVMSLGYVSARADVLNPYAEQDRLYLVPEYPFIHNWFSYSSVFYPQGDNGLRVYLHPYWQQSGDGVTVQLARPLPLEPVEMFPCLEYELQDGRLFVNGQAVQVSDTVPMDIPCDGREIDLVVPIPSADTLDLMTGVQIDFEQYQSYDQFEQAGYPVRLRLESPMQVLYALDRLASMLISGMFITGREFEVDDGEGGRVERRYTHRWTLASLLNQLLVQVYPPRTLNELVYRLLVMRNRFRDRSPWESVTVDGYRDGLAIVKEMSRSFPTLDGYLRERRALCAAVGWDVSTELPGMFRL